MAESDIRGDLQRNADGILDGWCWCADAPSERRSIEVLVDGKTVAAVVASRFREDLRQAGVGDGYHGFSVSLAKTLSALGDDSILTARDRRTAKIFGRIVMPGVGFPAGLRDRLRDLAALLSDLNDQIGVFAAVQHAGRARVPDGLRHIGESLLASAGVAGLGSMLPRSPTLLHPLPAPRLSLILRSSANARALLARIQASATACAASNAEILVVDMGEDPLGALLPSVQAGVRYFNGRGASASAGLNRAAHQARGRMLLFADASAIPLGPALAWFAAEEKTEAVHAAYEVSEAAGHFQPGLMRGLAQAGPGVPGGLLMALPRELFLVQTGLNTSIEDSSGLIWVDMLLRLRAAGLPVTVWPEAAMVAQPGTTPADDMLTAVSEADLRVFGPRWGLAV